MKVPLDEFDYFVLQTNYTSRLVSLRDETFNLDTDLKTLLYNNEFVPEETEIIGIRDTLWGEEQLEYICDQEDYNMIINIIRNHELESDGILIIKNENKMDFTILCSIIDYIGSDGKLRYCDFLRMNQINEIQYVVEDKVKILYVGFNTESG